MSANDKLNLQKDFIVHESDSSAIDAGLGFVYQYCVALEKCFDLEKGEKLYIEHFGDVAIKNSKRNSTSIEVKHRRKRLTENSIEFWNTLKNWLDPNFQIDDFASLVLTTTQTAGAKSAFSRWNQMNGEQRYDFLYSIYAQHKEEKISKKSAAFIQQHIFSSVDKVKRLKDCLKKIYISFESHNIKTLIKVLKDTRCDRIPEIRKDDYIRNLVGFISLRPVQSTTWSISREEFDEHLNKQSSQFSIGVHVFPNKYAPKAGYEISDNDCDTHKNSLFALKIKAIGYEEKTNEAIEQYLRCHLTLAELLVPIIDTKDIQQYIEVVDNKFCNKYELACLKQTPSKEFFLTQISDSCENWSIFSGGVNPWFRNGLLHDLMNDELRGLKWEVQNEGS